MIVPFAGASYGLAKWFNAFDVEDREQPLDCILTSKRRVNGWVYRYRCTVEGGLELDGVFVDRAHEVPLAVETGEPVRMEAARGRLGIWLRRSDPITPPRP